MENSKNQLEILDAMDSPLKPRKIEMINGGTYFVYGISVTLTVICTSFLGMGQLNAKEAIDYLDVDKATLTGICGGINKEMNYGDIIISNQIVDYELDKM